MNSLDVRGLPEPIVQSLQLLIEQIRVQLSASTTDCLPSGEGLKRAAGAWSDMPEEEFQQWEKGLRRSRGHEG